MQTLRHLYELFFSIIRNTRATLPYSVSLFSSDLKKEVTERYPDRVSSKTSDDLPPRTRGFLFNEIDLCTGCGDCQLVCPASCITVKNDLSPNPTKTLVSIFEIDHSLCVLCGLCIEVCHPQSLKHSKKFEYAKKSREEMIENFGKSLLMTSYRQTKLGGGKI